ncbi:unnamed protein product [Echinostoma caproni]|uniref:Uncharacterized protein n=1 Tax=Echinostoma caproni TaxID=27848 RepID=A0A183BGK4_9TREM|nr:unnamed protein product [Echinostoma caproni]
MFPSPSPLGPKTPDDAQSNLTCPPPAIPPRIRRLSALASPSPSFPETAASSQEPRPISDPIDTNTLQGMLGCT